MSAPLEMEITVKRDRPGTPLRNELTDGIGVALMCGGVRVSEGVYRVTVQRIAPLPKPPTESP